MIKASFAPVSQFHMHDIQDQSGVRLTLSYLADTRMKLARMRQVYGIPVYDHVYGPSYPSPFVMRNKVSVSLSNVKTLNSHLVFGM